MPEKETRSGANCKSRISSDRPKTAWRRLALFALTLAAAASLAPAAARAEDALGKPLTINVPPWMFVGPV